MSERRAIQAIRANRWAITEEGMDQMIAVASGLAKDPEAIERELGRPLSNDFDVRVRDGVAIIPVFGPTFRHASLFTRVSGATAFEELSLAFAEAVDDPAVKAIVFDFDTPGGEVNGTQELAQMIFEARGAKPIVSFGSHRVQSAGYWTASAADRLVISKTSMVGSIGAVLEIVDFSEQDGVKRYQYVSSVSPKKRPEPGTEEGDAQFSAIVNALGDAFVEDVARNRGVSIDHVLEHYGQGATLVGKEAQATGLVDGLGTLEGTIQSLIQQVSGAPRARSFSPAARGEALTATSQESTMPDSAETKGADTPEPMTLESLRANHRDLVTRIQAAAATAERERILGIHELPVKGFDSVKLECMRDPSVSRGAAAERLLEAQSQKEGVRQRAQADALEKDEEALAEAGLGASTAPETDADVTNDEAAAARILSAGKPAKATA